MAKLQLSDSLDHPHNVRGIDQPLLVLDGSHADLLPHKVINMKSMRRGIKPEKHGPREGNISTKGNHKIKLEESKDLILGRIPQEREEHLKNAVKIDNVDPKEGPKRAPTRLKRRGAAGGRRRGDGRRGVAGQMTGMLCGKAEIEIYVKSLGQKPSTRGITVQQQPKNLTVLRGTIAVKAPQRNISVFGKTHVILSVVLLLVYNCSDQFIKIRAKILSKSRRKAATIAQESATARGRWKLAKELVLSHELEMSESDQLAASSNEARHATEGNGKRSKNRKKLAHARTERFRRAYSQIGRERVLQPDNDKITLSGVVALAAENRSRRPMFEVVFKGLTLSIGKKKLLQCVTGKLSPGRVTAIMGPSGAGKTTFSQCCVKVKQLDIRRTG
ncbi:hypothetical protein OsI_33791 [Oryza sativa Indica Group]|uniref:ABC transporter domain-containing protein n=1 Tax=Oryza sativa subsp. indica TaxID=39946 RepID=B8BH49_ORYSI|nr:hypothetical protein OsI_33791 [Oryza sativa Indica Group]